MQFKKILTKKVLIILLLILAQSAGVSKVWGQEFEGIWYIDNDANHNLTPDNRWYLVPAKDSKQAKGVDAYYSPNYATTDGDPEKPFACRVEEKVSCKSSDPFAVNLVARRLSAS